MNRTGLLIALGLAALAVLIFALFPGLDLALARVFFDPQSGTFPMAANETAGFWRDAAMWLSWAIAAPSIVAVVVKLIWPNKPLKVVKGRTVAFLLLTIIMSAGILSNAGFKGYWGRPRPSDVIEFRGPWHFKNWWDSSGECPKNCSFFSGEATTAFWTYAPAALTPPQVRPFAYAGATLFGVLTGLLRMTFGGHFLSDVVAAGLATFLTVWLFYALIYRWRTRLTDEQIDAALTRAFWPLYRWRLRIAASFEQSKPSLPQRIVEAPHDD
jgi:membrane-associated PAP2 superfamily phosphatase